MVKGSEEWRGAVPKLLPSRLVGSLGILILCLSPLRSEIVINELFYHPADDREEGEYVEIHNSGQEPVDLEGYHFTNGIDFVFPEGAVIPGGGYILVARNAALIRANHGDVEAYGDWVGRLENDGERITLADPTGAPVDTVRYDDADEWPVGPDGFGRSLERISPDAPGDDPANWKASGAGTPDWVHIQATGPATSSRLYIYLLGPGECLVDGVEIRADGGAENFVPNGDFENDLDGWTPTGNHGPSQWQPSGGTSGPGCLHLVSTGTGGSSTNSVNRYTEPSLDTGGATYHLSLWAKHVSGESVLVVRLSGSGLLATTDLLLASTGTPGHRNSVYSPVLPPYIRTVTRTPIRSRSSQPVTVRAEVRGADTVSLYYDAGSGPEMSPMGDDGAHGDLLPGDGIFGGTIPPFPNGQIIGYRVTAEGSGGASIYPREGDPARRLAYWVEDAPVGSALPVYHLFIDSADLGRMTCTSYVNGTFIHNGEVYEEVGVRYRGGTSCGAVKKSMKVRFQKGREFLDQRRINLNGMWTDKSLIRERVAFDLYRDAGVPASRARHARVHLNGEFRGLYVEVEHPDGRFLERNHRDPDGDLYKAVDNRATGRTFSSVSEYERYYEKKTNETEPHDALIAFIEEINNTPDGDIAATIETNMDIDEFIDYLAATTVAGQSDHPHKNYYLYRNPDTGNRWEMYPWDLDLTLGKNYLGWAGGVYTDVLLHDNHVFIGSAAHPNYDNHWNRIINRFFTAPGAYFIEAYYSRIWDLLREKLDPQVLLPKIDYLERAILPEAQLDRGVWGAHNSNNPDVGYNIELVRDYVRNRCAYLEDYFESVGFHGHERVMITEIMYNPEGTSEDAEYLELYNLEDHVVDLSGWEIAAVRYVFPQGISIGPGEFLLVVRNPQEFEAVYRPAGVRYVGPYPGNLENAGEQVRLHAPGPGYPVTIDVVRYDDNIPWPPGADGTGHSLEIVGPGVDNELALSWRVSEYRLGSPGAFEGEPPPQARFIRGDANVNGRRTIGDVVLILRRVFASQKIPCEDAADSDDDEGIGVDDALLLLAFIFGKPVELPPPAVSPGIDPAGDLLGCTTGF